MPNLNHHETPDAGTCNGQGLRQRLRDEDLLTRIRITRIVLAAAHRDIARPNLNVFVWNVTQS
ncbi:hypothetical protein FF100_28450 [Methylobacterium terricola]|uniref:Uncharacterized protein n=1 Tax=Methylobacterium terricola TaxID=2583531 RepID=A0A5C4LBT9_9HYPH|nr:hypothetical protein [Methylobacterium terricola]TNC08771.1 hypothetical protein FF100_28450 [Methylobacterium terricola]